MVLHCILYFASVLRDLWVDIWHKLASDNSKCLDRYFGFRIFHFNELFVHKKVLLCERKRHTDRRIASTPSLVLTVVVPHPSLGGRYPIPGQEGPA